MVALEDLHWADPDTVSLVEYLADNAAGQPVLFACSLRTEPPSPASDLARRQRGRAGIVHLPLGRLSEREVAEMIAACSPGGDADEHDRVRRVSEGVPLFVEELLASPGIPETISDTVRERLAEFPDHERAVLEAAAVMGRHFDWEMLPVASGQAPEVVSRALARAVDRVLVTADGGAVPVPARPHPGGGADVHAPAPAAPGGGDGLAAVDTAHPGLAGGWRDLAADLAARSGDRARAGRLLRDSGRYSLETGALATGRMLLHCGGDIWQAGSGSWVQFPAGVPHTFRVLGGPARILLAHANDSFLAAVREIGRPATGTDIPDATQGPTIEELDRAFAAHGITNVGPPMEQAEAEHLLGELAGAARL